MHSRQCRGRAALPPWQAHVCSRTTAAAAMMCRTAGSSTQLYDLHKRLRHCRRHPSGAEVPVPTQPSTCLLACCYAAAPAAGPLASLALARACCTCLETPWLLLHHTTGATRHTTRCKTCCSSMRWFCCRQQGRSLCFAEAGKAVLHV